MILNEYSFSKFLPVDLETFLVYAFEDKVNFVGHKVKMVGHKVTLVGHN